MQYRNYVIGILLAIISFVVLPFLPSTDADYSKADFFIGNTSLKVTIADTPKERIRGLSGRLSLAEGEGMLFVYNTPGFYSFWMKNMLFPIDIIWMSPNYKIVHIAKDVHPNTYPKSFTSRESAQYILEVPAGWAARHGVKVGDYAGEHADRQQ